MKTIVIYVIVISLLLFGCQFANDKKLMKEQLGEFDILDYWNENVTDHIRTSYLIDYYGSNKLVQFVKVKGSQDMISLMITINLSEDKIENLQILQHNETPDYGGYIVESWYLDRYKDKSTKIPLRTVVMMDKKSNEIVAVTGATISSDAVTEAVNYCIENIDFLQVKNEGDENK